MKPSSSNTLLSRFAALHTPNCILVALGCAVLWHGGLGRAGDAGDALAFGSISCAALLLAFALQEAMRRGDARKAILRAEQEARELPETLALRAAAKQIAANIERACQGEGARTDP